MERASDVPREMVQVIQALVVLAVVSVQLDPLEVLRRGWARVTATDGPTGRQAASQPARVRSADRRAPSSTEGRP